MTVHVLVLNYNGQSLLESCLPSVLLAAECSQYDCQVMVIDNSSSDQSLEILAQRFPTVPVISRPNDGLCSFNHVLSELDGTATVLLNNDVRLHSLALNHLLAPLLDGPPDNRTFLTAARCWKFDGVTYEGQKTSIAWRRGLVQATALFEGHEEGILRPGLTASAGAAIAVDREKFLHLGGFDPIYLPGRLEDLDLSFRAYMAGYHSHYVPQAIAYHLGFGSFYPAFGEAGCDHLALRNTLLFQWLNLRHPQHLLAQACWIPTRLLADILTFPWKPQTQRWRFMKAFTAAIQRWFSRGSSIERGVHINEEQDYFKHFSPARMSAVGNGERHPTEILLFESPHEHSDHVLQFELSRTRPQRGEAA